jgi:hypothetical protein
VRVHDLLGALMSAADRWRVLPVPRAQLQPVGVHEAADAVAAASVDPPRLARVTVAGPEVIDLRSLRRVWQAAGGRRAIEIPIPLPGKVGRALRERSACESTFAVGLSAGSLVG